MGEMADFALDEVADMESRREDYVNGTMSDTSAFQQGIIDQQGGLCFDERNYELDGFTGEDYLRSIEKLMVSGGHKDISSWQNIQKYHKKWSMLRGMRDQVMRNRPLTEKQKKWLSTNITFDVSQFASVCKQSKNFRDKIEYYWKLTSGQFV